MPCGATVTAPPHWQQAGFWAAQTGTPELVTHQQRWLVGGHRLEAMSDSEWPSLSQAHLTLVPLHRRGSGGDTGSVVPSMVTWDRTFPTYCKAHESCLSWWIYHPITSSCQPE